MQIKKSKLFPKTDPVLKQWKQRLDAVNGSILAISQFTLFGTVDNKGNMDFKSAMSTEPAKSMYDLFLTKLRNELPQTNIQSGVFGAMMKVSLCNDVSSSNTYLHCFENNLNNANKDFYNLNSTFFKLRANFSKLWIFFMGK